MDRNALEEKKKMKKKHLTSEKFKSVRTAAAATRENYHKNPANENAETDARLAHKDEHIERNENFFPAKIFDSPKR